MQGYTVYSYRVTESGLIIEIAVPGREGEDLDVRVNEDDTMQITMPAKENTLGSLLGMSMAIPITNLLPRWNVHEVEVSCKNGLLRLVFPAVTAEPEPEPRKRRPIKPEINIKTIFNNRLRGLI